MEDLREGIAKIISSEYIYHPTQGGKNQRIADHTLTYLKSQGVVRLAENLTTEERSLLTKREISELKPYDDGELPTFWGGENGFDYICLGKKIECSGKLKDMLAYARKFNWAVAKLVPIRFSKPTSKE